MSKDAFKHLKTRASDTKKHLFVWEFSACMCAFFAISQLVIGSKFKYLNFKADVSLKNLKYATNKLLLSC